MMGGGAGKLLRLALHAFFRHYHPSSSSASLLALPFSAAVLLSRSHPSSLLAPASRLLSLRLRAVLVAAGFPPSSQLLFLLTHRLSHRACASLAALPFSLSFLLLAKACAVHHCSGDEQQRRRRRKDDKTSASVGELVWSSYPAMVRTQLVNILSLLLANAAVFAALLAAFNAAEALHLLPGGAGGGGSSRPTTPTTAAAANGRAVVALSALGVIVYSVAAANAAAVCNLATVVAAAEPEGGGGARAMLKAVLMLLRAGDGAAAAAVAASLPASLAAAAVEALFQVRVMRPYAATGRVTAGMICEGLLVAYIHAMICVLDTVVTTMVYRSCKATTQSCQLLDLEMEMEMELDDDGNGNGKEDLRV